MFPLLRSTLGTGASGARGIELVIMLFVPIEYLPLVRFVNRAAREVIREHERLPRFNAKGVAYGSEACVHYGSSGNMGCLEFAWSNGTACVLLLV
jgi:hypothetical protein